jgi:hypothetical protein
MTQPGSPDYSHPSSDPDLLGCIGLPRTTTTTTEADSGSSEAATIAAITGGGPTPAGHSLW